MLVLQYTEYTYELLCTFDWFNKIQYRHYLQESTVYTNIACTFHHFICLKDGRKLTFPEKHCVRDLAIVHMSMLQSS
jgi:hypothetical protein